jgi:hypothetical protein
MLTGKKQPEPQGDLTNGRVEWPKQEVAKTGAAPSRLP